MLGEIGRAGTELVEAPPGLRHGPRDERTQFRHVAGEPAMPKAADEDSLGGRRFALRQRLQYGLQRFNETAPFQVLAGDTGEFVRADLLRPGKCRFWQAAARSGFARG